MTALLRPLFERWLLDATEAPLTPWKRSLLLWALRRDAALRALALELAAFEHEASPTAAGLPDLRPRLHAILASGEVPLERPLFPSGWIPAGALAALLLVALLMTLLEQVPSPQAPQMAMAGDSQTARDLALPTSTPTATPTAADPVPLPGTPKP